MDRYRINHNDNIINLQLENKVKDINDDFSKSRLKSFKNSVNSIIKNITDFFLNLGKPLFKNRQADRILDSNDYNKNIDEISNDIDNAYSQINTIKKIAKNNENYSELYNDFLTPIVNQISTKTTDIAAYLNDPTNINLNIHEDFNNTNNIDNETNALIDTREGIATLGVSSRDNILPENTKIRIINSNGYPGNMHEVQITNENQLNQRKGIDIEGVGGAISGIDVDVESVDIGSYEYIEEDQRNIKFKYETSPHLHTANIIDNNPETMFQYELCNIPDEIKNNHLQDFELEYKEGEVWAKDPEEGYLTLTLEFELPEPQLANQLNLIPYQPTDGGETKIIEVNISPSKNLEPKNIYRESDIIESQEYRKENNTFYFPEQNIQIIQITLEQHSPYETKIGNMFCEHHVVVEETTSYLWGVVESSEVEERVERVECGQISLENLEQKAQLDLATLVGTAGAVGGAIAGAKYGAAMGSVAGPPGAILGAIAGAVLGSGLASSSTEVIDSDTKVGIEAFDGWRWALGVKHLSLNRNSYQPTSQIITKNYNTPYPIKKLKIDTIEDIPQNFYNHNNNPWVEYHFSVDDGGSWHQIAPYNQHNGLPSVFIINSEEIEELKKEGYEYITTSNNPNQIKFMIIFNRPKGEEYKFYTPAVVSFKSTLVVLPEEGEENEY